MQQMQTQAHAAQQAAAQQATAMHGRQQQVFVRSGLAAGSGNPMASRWPPGQHQGGGVPGRSTASPNMPQARAGAGAGNSLGLLPSQQAGDAMSHFQAPHGRGIAQQPHGVQEGEFLDPDQDPNALRSPGGSLVSSVTTLPCPLGAGDGATGWTLGQHSARGAGGSLGINVHEALATMETLAVRVNESLEQLPTRLDEASSEFRAETNSLRGELRGVSEASASCLVRTEALKEELREHVAEGLAGEREQRQEVAEELRNLARDLREQFQQEMERLRDSVMREMRERMDGQKVLREEVQLQQGSLLRLTSRLEESLVELRTELPRLGQEQTGQREDIQRIQEAVGMGGQGGGGLQARLDQLERLLREQREQRQAAEAEIRQELRGLQQTETARLEQQLANVKERADEQHRALQQALDGHRADCLASVEAQAKTLEKRKAELLEALEEKARTLRQEHTDCFSNSREELRTSEEKLQSKLADSVAGLSQHFDATQNECRRNEMEAKEQLQQQLNGLERALVELDDSLRGWSEKRFGEFETGIQSWVEANVSGRITMVDKSLKKEMAERSSTNEQVLDMITHNSERWCQLQAKFDELLVQVQKGSLASVVSGSTGSHGANTPVGSNFGGGSGSGVDLSNGGPLAGRSLEDR
eukprot:TRINITY_DN6514_c0_g3_i2.p1 TRINITY_DN6514_c0_g3~~TRINITY_DN6514_c0_g3_i2.p1  ORF type:complete len:679 (-),score=158.09 TRINITY_DN6514_c0_g3_i2:38-1978(-)